MLTIEVTWRVSWRDSYCLPIVMTSVHLRFLVGSVLLICLIFCAVLFIFFVFVLCLVYPMLRVYLDCPLLIAPSGFSSIYSLIIITIIFQLEGMYGPNKTALNPPLFIKMPGPRHKSERSWTCLLKAGPQRYRFYLLLRFFYWMFEVS